MSEESTKESESALKKMGDILPEMRAAIKSHERRIRLMEAGLKELPLERDFVELERFKLREKKDKLGVAETIHKSLTEAFANMKEGNP